MTLWYTLYINNTEKADGTLTPVWSNPAVPVELLKKVQDLLKGGISIEDIVDRLRTEAVPKGVPMPPLAIRYVYMYNYVLYVEIMYSGTTCSVCIACVLCIRLQPKFLPGTG